MDVPILGGGIIMLVAVLLWLVYLVPSWIERMQYSTTERNAMRLGRALRILAESSEAPAEVQLELDTRTAYEQQRLARQLEAERARAERAQLAQQRRIEAEVLAEKTRLAQQTQQTERELAIELSRAEAAEAQRVLREQQQQARARRLAAEAEQAAAAAVERRGSARRRVRVSAALVLLVGLGLTALGTWSVVATGAWSIAAIGASLTVVALLVLQRVARVAARAKALAHRAETDAPVARKSVPPVLFEQEQQRDATAPVPTWTPRQLPVPMSSQAGSAAAAAQDTIDARTALRRAALEEAQRARAERQRPQTLAAVRAAREEQLTAATPDEVMEAHVRDLLQRRAAG